ncbi:MAG: hypothetical protein R3B48_24645 [Kofleriaceae bacterium]
MTTKMFKRLPWLGLTGLLVGLQGCAALDEPAEPGVAAATPTETTTSELGTPQAIQLGANLAVLGTTEDGYALYWDAGVVYATALQPGAARTRVTRAAAPPLTMTSGRVALVWPDQAFFGPLAPSSLVVWTAAGGAHRAADSSMPPALSAIAASTAVSPDGREVIFTANVAADGSTGDIVRANADLSRATILVRGALVSPFSGCPPHVGFDADRACHGPRWYWHADETDATLRSRRANAVVASCDASGAPSLARWVGGARSELTTNLGSTVWSTDRFGAHLLTTAGDGSTVAYTRDGASLVVNPDPSLAWITPGGAAFTLSRRDPTTVTLQRTTFGAAVRTERVMDVGETLGVMFANHLAQGAPHYNITPNPMSPDQQFFGGFNTVDPNTGLTNAILVDAGRRRLRAASANANALPSVEIATRDSSHMLHYQLEPDGTFAMYATARTGGTRRLSQGATGLEHYGIAGGVVAFSDNFQGNPADLLSTTDIKLVDLAAGTAPRVLTRAAHATFFTARRRSVVVYSTEQGRPGLYVTRVR